MLGVAFATGVITARLLGPSGKGVIAYFQALSVLLFPIAELGVRQSTAFLLGQKTYSQKDVIGNMKALYFASASISFCALLLIYLVAGVFPKYGYLLPSLFLLILPISLFQSYHNGVLIGTKQIEKINYLQISDKLATFFLMVILLYFFRLEALGAGVSYLTAQIIGLILLMLWLRPIFFIAPKFSQPIFKILVSKGFFFALSLFVIQMNYRVDVLMLASLKDDASVGVYSVGVNICEILKELPLALGLVLFSRSANWNASEIKESLNKTLMLCRIVLLFMVIAGAGLGVVSRWLIPSVYGVSFAPSVDVILILIPGIVMLSVFLILSFFIAGQGKPHLSLFVFTPALLLNVGLNFILIPKYGSSGCAISSTISYSVAAVLYAVIFSRLYKVRLTEVFFVKKSDLKEVLNRRKLES